MKRAFPFTLPDPCDTRQTPAFLLAAFRALGPAPAQRVPRRAGRGSGTRARRRTEVAGSSALQRNAAPAARACACRAPGSGESPQRPAPSPPAPGAPRQLPLRAPLRQAGSGAPDQAGATTLRVRHLRERGGHRGTARGFLPLSWAELSPAGRPLLAPRPSCGARGCAVPRGRGAPARPASLTRGATRRSPGSGCRRCWRHRSLLEEPPSATEPGEGRESGGGGASPPPAAVLGGRQRSIRAGGGGRGAGRGGAGAPDLVSLSLTPATVSFSASRHGPVLSRLLLASPSLALGPCPKGTVLLPVSGSGV